jgi:hypothetical protein
VTFKPSLLLLAVGAVAAFPCAVAQTPDPQLATSCNPWIIQTLPTELSFRQRTCLGLAQMASPGLFLGAAAVAGISQWRNSPRITPRDGDDYALRFEHLYERQVARVTAEVLVGQLHHEDPRYHPSNAQGTWRRIRASLLTVVESPDEDGHLRPAFVPIAGSFGSGLTSMALYQHQNELSDGLRRSGFSYCGYFARAIIHEFSPELWSMAPGFVRKRHDAIRKVFTL